MDLQSYVRSNSILPPAFTKSATRAGLDLVLNDNLLKRVILIPCLGRFVDTTSLLTTRLILVHDSTCGGLVSLWATMWITKSINTLSWY